MEKYGDGGYGPHIDAFGYSVAAGERAEYEYVEQLPTAAAAAASGEEEGTRTSVDTSGFGMYSSGTGTGAINGGGILPDQYAAIQTQLPCSPADYNSHGETHHEKKGLMERIKEKLPGHHHHRHHQ